MIDEEITYREKGYYSTDLSRGSGKPVWAVCEGEDCQREGGRGRWVVFQSYRRLCRSCAMKNLPIERCETPTEKLPWIDDEITYAEKGYKSTWLKPQSNKPVWCVCANPDCEREGGRGRWLKFQDCREFCRLCVHKTDEHRKNLSNSLKDKYSREDHPWLGKHHTDKSKRKMTESRTGEKNHFYGKHHSDKTKNLMSESGIGKTCSYEARINMSAAQQGIPIEEWDGFISFGKYCEKFNNKFKESIREKFGRECFLCEMDEEMNKRKLDVHHVSYDKECMCNDIKCEFVPLCKKCHGITNGNRELWRRMIMNQLAMEGWI